MGESLSCISLVAGRPDCNVYTQCCVDLCSPELINLWYLLIHRYDLELMKYLFLLYQKLKVKQNKYLAVK